VHNYDDADASQMNSEFLKNNYNENDGDMANNNSSNICTGAGTLPINMRHTLPPARPFHIGEMASSGNYVPTQGSLHYYNNYELSFHNEIWSTAMMGHFTTGLSFIWENIHRWPGSEMFPDFSDFQLTGTYFTFFDENNQPFFTDQIKTFYHHYKRLSEFTSNIDFGIEWIPGKYYDNSNKIESYYLIDPNGTYAYGWIRNLNHIWFNEYYYDNNNFEYQGCENGVDPSTAFDVEGLTPSASYEVSFYRTVMGNQPLPNDYSTSADNAGKVQIDLSTLPLGCDSNRADYAFRIYAPPQLRVTNPNSSHIAEQKILAHHKPKVQSSLQFNILPNPSSGIFKVTIPLNDEDKAVIIITDVTGRETLKYENINTSIIYLRMDNFSKGIYFMQVKINDQQKIKKIILQ
jgi:hypothetical protein